MEPFPALRRQWAVARIQERTLDEWEQVSRIWVPITAPLVTPFAQDYADVEIRFAGIESWRGAILLIQNGVLDTLHIGGGNGETIAPMPPIEEICYTMLVTDPDDPDELVAIPVHDRDWGMLQEEAARRAEREEN